jgi:predicted CopG family antitoxin
MNRIINLLLGRVSLPLDFERNLSANASTRIKNITICRKPIQQALRSVLNVASKGELESKLKGKGHDELYHLYAVLTLDDGTSLRYEKNQRPILTPHQPSAEDVDCVLVERTIGIPLGEFIRKAVSSMGKTRYVQYDAFKNNCQDFLLASLRANNLVSTPISEFIKQDVSDLLSPEIEKGASLATDVAGVVSDIKDIYTELKAAPSARSSFSDFIEIFTKGVPSVVVENFFSKDSHVEDLISLLHKPSPPQNKIEIPEEPPVEEA